jgi:polysaccharide pyruvyl transferase WcaK-like protein
MLAPPPVSGSKQAVIVGAVGANLGDEAIARAVAAFMAPEVCCTIFTFGPSGDGLVHVDRRSAAGWRNAWRAIRGADVVVLGGGSLVQDTLDFTPVSGLLTHVRHMVLLARLAGKPIVTAPIGVDQLHHRLAKRYARAILRASRLTLVRDRDSADRAQRLLPTLAPITAADPAFLLDLPAPATSSHACILLAEPRYLGRRHVQVLIDVAQELARAGLEVLLVPMDDRPDQESPLFEALLAEPGCPPRTRILPAPLAMTIATLRSARLVVTMRLHGAILALGYAPVVGISRGEKTNSLFATAAVPFVGMDEAPFAGLPRLVAEALQDVRLLSKQSEAAVVERAKARAGLTYLKETILSS